MEINFPRPLPPSANPAPADAAGAAEKVVRVIPASPGMPQNSPSPDSARTDQLQQAGEKALRQAVDELQRKVQISAANLHFSIDHETGRTVVKVTDANTQEVIRQIPPEEILHLDQALDRMWGLLLHKEG